MDMCIKVSMHSGRAQRGQKNLLRHSCPELSINFLATQYHFTIYLPKVNNNNNTLVDRAIRPFVICYRTVRGVSDTKTVD